MAPKSSPSKSDAKPAAGKDIRSFFGGGGGGGIKASSQSTSTARPSQHSLKRKKPSALLSSDDGDDEKPPMKKASPPKKVAVNAKPKPKSKPITLVLSDDDEEEKPVPKPKPAAKKREPKRIMLVSSNEDEEEKPAPKPKPEKLVNTKPKSKRKPIVSSDEDEEEKPVLKPKSEKLVNAKSKPKRELIVSSDEDEEEKPVPKSKSEKVVNAKPKPKRKHIMSSDEGEEKKPVPKPKPKPAAKEETGAKEKFDWAAAKAAKIAAATARSSRSKEIPNAKDPNALSGLAFVFTGELDRFSRDEAIDLAKRFGGRVTGQPSSVTNFVVLGSNAGPSKLAAIKKHGLTTISEDEFLNLIATREVGENLDAKTKKKMEKEQEAIRQGAKELEKREKGKQAAGDSHKGIDPSTQLWTTRYAPQTLKEICGNKGQVEKLQNWLNGWAASRKANFKKPGKEGMNIFRAVMITGPPGIGKTTSAHLCAQLAGFTPIEVNASDSRSKKLVETGVNMDNRSLDGWMGDGKATNAAGIPVTDKTCLIMDEVDGMSAGDRGGVGALNSLIKKTKIPIICIANDRNAQKLKPLMATTFSLRFQKPDAAAVRSRMMTIAFKEKMKIPPNVIDQLVTGAQSDIRQILNMLSTWRLSSDSMTFDEGKNLAKSNEKTPIMTSFDILNKMMGPYLFSQTARETLGDKMELYFHDHSFVPLFIQENYLKTEPSRIRNLAGPDQTLVHLELMDKAASSISDGDLVDALIHGPEQHWGLMPLHAVCSAVRPASFLYGTGGGWGSKNQMSAPQWLGQNSKQGRLSRQLGDVQIRMRLKVSGDKAEIRQSYIPALFPHIVKPLMDVGASAVEDVIEHMDEYYLSREDWDTVVELGLDEQKDEIVLKKISAATKTTLTKKYNANAHPIPFHKAQDLGKAPKKIAAEPAPDCEEAYNLEEDNLDAVSDDEGPKKKKSPDDISTDKLIKPKGKGKGKGKSL